MTKQEMRERVNKLNYYTQLYDLGRPQISDAEWDKMYFELQEAEKESGVVFADSPTNYIPYNFEVVSKLEKKTHNHPMLSAAKTKDWNEFIHYFDGHDVTGMLKLDGLTCSLEYQDGKLIGAETRGNGEVGENILHNALVIKSIPKDIVYTGHLIVDGEIICRDQDFEPFKEEYANSRNFASGSIRLLDSKECAKRNLTFVAWNVVEGFDEYNRFFMKMNAIQKEGFTVVPWTSSFDLDAKEFLIDEAKRYGYPIDGLVGRFDDIAYGESLGATGHHSRAIYAFKFYDEEYESKLLNIEWGMGRTGQLTPIAIFEDIDFGDSIVNRASLSNLAVLKEKLGEVPFKYQKIKVFKANMIIPQISWSESLNDASYIGMGDSYWYKNNGRSGLVQFFEKPTVCPYCGKPVVRRNDFLYCDNPNCDAKLINVLEHFLGKKGLDVKGISKATLEKLIDWGWINDIEDIFNLQEHRDEWVKKAGFGIKSVDKILAAIESGKNCELWQFISAIGIPLIGSTVAKDMARRETDWHNIREDIAGHFDFTKWQGFGPEMKDSLLNFDYTRFDKIADRLNISNGLREENSVANSLNGKSFCITGKLKHFKNREELQSNIENHGGKIVSSVSSKTDYLINNDSASASAKNKKAQELGVKIITEADYMLLIN